MVIHRTLYTGSEVIDVTWSFVVVIKTLDAIFTISLIFGVCIFTGASLVILEELI